VSTSQPVLRPRSAVLALAASALTLGVLAMSAAPASADTRHFADASGDMTTGQEVHPGDIEDVVVRNAHRLHVSVSHADLAPDAVTGAQLFIDTDAERRGPELVLSAGLYDGTDYQLNRARRWAPVGGPLACSYQVELHYGTDRSEFTIGRGCLGAADEVRVALRVSGPGSEAVDWLTDRRTFTPAIAR
jgi:hypothetical protein